MSRRNRRRSVSTTVDAPGVAEYIAIVRGQRVLFDRDLARLYGVRPKALVQAVKRNPSRFPSDFMFQLNAREQRILRSQNVTSSSWGGRRTAPYAFTEQGVAMLSSVLRSARAARVNVEIMRAFVRFRRILRANTELMRRLQALERSCDARFGSVFDTLRAILSQDVSPRRRIGFGS